MILEVKKKKGIFRMKDLKISFKNENGEIVHREYDTIMDFIDEMESDSLDIPMLDYTDVHAMFFENELNQEDFNTINDLLFHCNMIVK